MLLGPVFHAELLTTSRRARYYVVRVIYGASLLAVLWSGYRRYEMFAVLRDGSERMSIREMSAFAVSTFSNFTALQAYTIVLLTPALVAPVIASEKSRKTMHYLLSSQLNSAEIVLGKLAARLLMLGVILAVGIPVFCLLQLFGGIEAQAIVRAYLMLGALLVFLAGMSILVSTLSAEPRRAIFFGYAAPALFVAFPFVLNLLLFRFPTVRRGVSEAFAWLWPLPREALLPFKPPAYFRGVADAYFWDMVRVGVLGTLYGLGFMALAVALVRPVGRREEKRRRGELRIDKQGRWRWQALPRPPVGDDAMFWKERYTTRWSGVVKLGAVLAQLFLAALIGCFLYEWIPDAWRESRSEGFVSTTWEGVRGQVNEYLRTVSMLVLGLWMLGTAAVAAGSITTERESDTWISLLSTPLTGGEIVLAKVFGAIARFKWLGVLLGLLWVIGLAVGALHPLGVVFALVEVPLFVGFAAALGVACSLGSKTTTRALALTIGLLAVLNGGYLIVLATQNQRDRDPYMGGVAPWVLGGSLATYPDVNLWYERESYYRSIPYNPGRDPTDDDYTRPRSQLHRALWAIGTAIPLYLLGGAFLLVHAIHRFDRVSDRPKAEHDAGSDLPASERRKQLVT